MGLFRRKTTIEDAVRGHLERVEIPSSWLSSALAAIKYCETGEPFAPVLGVGGPAPARSVVALMSLEPFVRGEIDWSISPGESPLWVGAIGDLDDEAFEATVDRFLELYPSPVDPAIRPELERTFEVMVQATREMSDEAEKLEEQALQGLRALAAAGYVWRLAEKVVPTTDVNPRADVAHEVDAVVAAIAKEGADDEIFGRAASECLRRDLLLASGSPGGWATGGEFLRRGFRFADRYLQPNPFGARKQRWYAFSFGVALFEVDECLVRRPAWAPRRLPRLALVR